MTHPVSCLAPFVIASALSGCVLPTYVQTNNADPCARVVVQDPNYGTARSAQSAIADANKSGSFKGGPGFVSSNSAPVGITVTRRSNNPACK